MRYAGMTAAVSIAIGLAALPADAQPTKPIYQQPTSDSAEVIRGEVTIDVIRHRGLGVAVDVDDPADGVVDHLFILEYVGLIPSEVPIHLPRAQVVFKGDHLVVADLEGPTLAGFFLGDRFPLKSGEVLTRHLGRRSWSGEDEIYVYTGFGIVRAGSSWVGSSWTELGLADGEPSFEKSFCQSGGIGSTSCSQTCSSGQSCSTTCASGYFACCKCELAQATCTCERSSGGGGGGGGGGFGGPGDPSCSGDPWCPPECARCGGGAY